MRSGQRGCPLSEVYAGLKMGRDAADSPPKNETTRRPHSVSPGGLAHDLGSRSADDPLDDLGKLLTHVGKGVEVVLALATAVDESPVPQESQMVAHRRLAHVELVAQPSGMTLPFGEQGDDLESGRIADLLEQGAARRICFVRSTTL